MRVAAQGNRISQESFNCQTIDSGQYTEGTQSAFESIFLEYYSRIVALFMRLVGDRAQAEELAEEVFLKLYQHPLQPSDRGHKVGGWLYRTATHLGIDALRAAARRKHYEGLASTKALNVDTASDPLEDAVRAESRQRVRAALARLKTIQAQLLILRYSGLSYKELAEALKLKPSSVGTLLARAEAEFERCYRKLYVS